MCGYSTEDEHSAGQRCLGLFDTALDASAVRGGRDGRTPYTAGGGGQVAGKDSRVDEVRGVFDSLTGFSHQRAEVRRAGETPAPQPAKAGETPAPRRALADKPPVAQFAGKDSRGDGCEKGFSHQLAQELDSDESADELAVIRAGWAEEAGEGCVTLDPAAVLRANRRSFALRVRGQSMIGAGICDGDIVVGEFTPEAKPGAIVVALIDGESTLKRFIMQHGKAYLASENPNYPDLVPLSELVIQGVVHTVVRRMR